MKALTCLTRVRGKRIVILCFAPMRQQGFYGPGHNSFTVDENGDDIMVYHARTETEIVGNPLYNPNRHAMLMRFGWKDGRPVFSYN